jgi:hypothetical protein
MSDEIERRFAKASEPTLGARIIHKHNESEALAIASANAMMLKAKPVTSGEDDVREALAVSTLLTPEAMTTTPQFSTVVFSKPLPPPGSEEEARLLANVHRKQFVHDWCRELGGVAIGIDEEISLRWPWGIRVTRDFLHPFCGVIDLHGGRLKPVSVVLEWHPPATKRSPA